MGVHSKLPSDHGGNACFALFRLGQMIGKTITEKNKIIPVIVFSSPVAVFPFPVSVCGGFFPKSALRGVLR